MIAHHFADIFQEEPEYLERARQLEPKVYEFSRFLLEVAGVEDVGARLDEVVTYHDSCHALRELKVKDGPRRLLSHVRGLELREMDAAEECCGFGGTFSVKFREVSGGMARNKIDSILRTGASAVVSVDSSCLMQLQGALSRAGLPIRTLHLAEVLPAGDPCPLYLTRNSNHARRWQANWPSNGRLIEAPQASRRKAARLPGTAHTCQRGKRHTSITSIIT
jgi:L-lactate dehydrogenase complex protein LldE